MNTKFYQKIIKNKKKIMIKYCKFYNQILQILILPKLII